MDLDFETIVRIGAPALVGIKGDEVALQGEHYLLSIDRGQLFFAGTQPAQGPLRVSVEPCQLYQRVILHPVCLSLPVLSPLQYRPGSRQGASTVVVGAVDRGQHVFELSEFKESRLSADLCRDDVRVAIRNPIRVDPVRSFLCPDE